MLKHTHTHTRTHMHTHKHTKMEDGTIRSNSIGVREKWIYIYICVCALCVCIHSESLFVCKIELPLINFLIDVCVNKCAYLNLLCHLSSYAYFQKDSQCGNVTKSICEIERVLLWIRCISLQCNMLLEKSYLL